MTERLRGALAEIADRAPVARVPDDTYQRGRRSHHRRVAAGALALVLACVGAGSMVRSIGHDDPPVVDTHSRGGAVPSRLYDVPERLYGQTESGRWTGPVETDLAIGTGAVAWQTTGPPVVVTARDGAYHLLDLPGFAGNDYQWSLNQPALMLSPDGRSLAYAWLPGRADDSGGPSGIRVLDLVSGELRSIPLRVGRHHRALVEQLAWSPDSRWLAWYGEVVGPYSGNRLGAARGVVAPGSRTSRPLPSPRDEATAMAVDDEGRVILLTTNQTLRVEPTGEVVRGPSSLPRPISVGTGAGRRAEFNPGADLLSLPSSGPTKRMFTLEVGSARRLEHPLPADLYPDGSMIVPLGWIDDGRLLALLDPEGPAPDNVKERDLVVMTPTRSQTSTFRIVGHAEGTVPVSLSVAVDLMEPDHYTADMPAPDWPWSAERQFVVVLLVLLSAGLAVWVATGLIRRRRAL